MKRDRFYLIIIGLLVFVNLTALIFILKPGNRDDRPRRNGFDILVQERLQLNEDQQKQFNKMKAEHHQAMVELDEQMREPFETYFSLLGTTGNKSQKDSLEGLIASIYRKKISYTYAHFTELKSLLNEDQKEKFKELVPHLLNVLTPNKGPEGMPPPPFHEH